MQKLNSLITKTVLLQKYTQGMMAFLDFQLIMDITIILCQQKEKKQGL